MARTVRRSSGGAASAQQRSHLLPQARQGGARLARLPLQPGVLLLQLCQCLLRCLRPLLQLLQLAALLASLRTAVLQLRAQQLLLGQQQGALAAAQHLLPALVLAPLGHLGRERLALGQQPGRGQQRQGARY